MAATGLGIAGRGLGALQHVFDFSLFFRICCACFRRQNCVDCFWKRRRLGLVILWKSIAPAHLNYPFIVLMLLCFVQGKMKPVLIIVHCENLFAASLS